METPFLLFGCHLLQYNHVPLSIEGNRLSVEQVRAISEHKEVAGLVKDKQVFIGKRIFEGY